VIPGNSHACRNLAAFASIVFLAAQIWLCIRPATGVQPAGREFLGFAHLPTDHYAYTMYAEQTRADGAILTKNLFTTAPQDGRFLMIGLVAAGAIESIIPLPGPIVWHTLRILVLALFCLLLWHLCLAVFDRPGRALAAQIFVLFSGGIDWLIRPLLYQWLSTSGYAWANFLDNPWNFNIFYASTNLVWAIPTTVITALVLFQIRNRQSLPKNRFALHLSGFISGLGFAVLWFLHPYSAMVWGLAVVVSVFVPNQTGRPYLPALGQSLFNNLAALTGPLTVAAFIIWSSEDPVAAASNAQTGLWKLNYPVFLYPIVYGPWVALPFFLIHRNHEKAAALKPGGSWLVIWLAAAFALTLNPFVTGAKFQSSIFIPLALLEMAGLYAVLDRLAARKQTRNDNKNKMFNVTAIATFLLVTSGNSIAGLAVDVTPESSRFAATASTEHLAALEFLRNQPSGGILCDPWEGMIVPWKTGKPVFAGQWFLSTRYNEKADLVKWFFSGGGKPEQIAGFLNSAGISYVMYGPREAAFGPMPQIEGLTRIYRQADREIWQFKGNAAAQ
jgi:hypothetical protein